jgi:hypothetical protein
MLKSAFAAPVENNDDKIETSAAIGDMPIVAEPVGYAADELIGCPKCGRRNAPVRVKCLYCAAELGLADISGEKTLNLRTLESWQNGFNVVRVGRGNQLSPGQMDKLKALVSIDAENLNRIVESPIPLPMARVELQTEAEIIADRVSKFGIETLTVSDVSLAADKPPVRLRSLEFAGNNIVLVPFNEAAPVDAASEDVVIAVTGAVFESRIETTEKRKKGVAKTLNEMQTAADEQVIDIYLTTGMVGYRIPARGFDFSCLGDEKAMLAAENMATLWRRMREFAPVSKFCEEYLRLRPLLDQIWEPERRTDSMGFQRSGFGKRDLTKIRTENNRRQFTKFSRLQRILL